MRQLLLEILQESAPPAATAWLRERIAHLEDDFHRRAFYFAFSGVSRHFPKAGRPPLTDPQKEALREAAPEVAVETWDDFILARAALLLVLAERGKPDFLETTAALLNTADLRETTAIYSTYPLLPHPQDLVESAVDGLRSNIVDIFDAIALGNPFPARHFSEEAWNQMVLKAIFLDRPLHRIVGLDARRNATLAGAVSDLAHERWAAGRRLPAEAWRNCVGLVSDRMVPDLHQLLERSEAGDREAAALVIAADGDPRLAELRGCLEGEIDAIGAGTLTWDRLGERHSAASPAKP